MRRVDRLFGVRRLAALAVGLVVLSLMVVPAVSLAQPSETPFEVEPGSFTFVPSSLQAGAHADWTFGFNFANEGGKTFNDLKDAAVDFPAGFTANNTAVPTCSFAQLIGVIGGESECPPASQVGTISFDFDAGVPERVKFPVYNLEVTSFGVTAELGFKATDFTQVLPVYVRPTDEGITGTSPSTAEIGEPHDISLTIWALPGAAEHNAERGEECFSRGPTYECRNGGEEIDAPVKPYLANPTSCGTFTASMKADSWEEPQPAGWLTEPVQAGPLGQFTEGGPIAECERVPFDPSIQALSTTTSAESPSGLNVSILVPQTWENPDTIATSNLKDATVTLPEGMTINPSAGSGLGACTPEEYASETSSSPVGAGCPEDSKIGSIEIQTPLLAETIPGAIYIATPYDNPFSEEGHPNGSLLALYVVAKDPARGILVKVAGKITPNPETGQLVSTFDEDPQQPFSKFTLKFRPGATAPLVSPPVCGSYSTQAALTPWSAPGEPHLISSQPFQVTSGAREGACPTGGVPPFKPTVVSGTENNAAGSYSPFYLRIERQDGEQEIAKFSTTLPPGLTGDLTGIPFCPEADIQAAKGVTGADEEAHPSCPAASEIGHTIVEAGVGSVLAQTPGKVYLAGPYHGAPLSIVSITSAKVGPFDLGTVVIRFALDINPITAQVEVSGAQSDPIPHIIKGIVVHVRDIRVYMSREKFIENPTSCEPMAITNAITGAGANPAVPADQDTVGVSTHFQVADCSSLAFQPTFKASTSGKTSKANGTSLHVSIVYPKAAQGTQANIHEVKVELPKQLPSRLSTLQKACTSKQFAANPAGCPAASIVGHAKAITPILPVPLEGPAYFVSYGAAKFPELVLVLQGYGITIDLHGETFISKEGITSSTFKTVPDQPVESFELTLPAGPYSALTNNGSLCKVTNTVLVKKRVKVRRKGHVKTVTRKVEKKVAGKLLMPTTMIAQNGAEMQQSTVISVSGCGKTKVKAKRGRHKSGRRSHHGHRR